MILTNFHRRAQAVFKTKVRPSEFSSLHKRIHLPSSSANSPSAGHQLRIHNLRAGIQSHTRNLPPLRRPCQVCKKISLLRHHMAAQISQAISVHGHYLVDKIPAHTYSAVSSECPGYPAGRNSSTSFTPKVADGHIFSRT